ncbi:MAG: transcription termination factor NusA [Clostridiales bacterium]|jgi:N utilization substance protein A|nr:transcription termination factor NusA [Clostridiales bacterium]
MDSGSEIIEALRQIEKEKGIAADVIFEAIESSLVTAYKNNFDAAQNVKVVTDRERGSVAVYALKTVVEEPEDEYQEISLERARELNPIYNLGDVAEILVTPRDFWRKSAQVAKQVVVQKFREAERKLIYDEYKGKEREIVTGIVQRKERRNIIVALGRVDAVLASNEQIPGENFMFNERVKVYVLEVRDNLKGPQVYVSRTHPDLVRRLFEQEVPEVFDGTVEIKAIAREAGSRSKVAVHSRNPNVDAVGSCVGQNGSRVNFVVQELKGEKIDIINWSPDLKSFVASSLSPSNALAVAINEREHSARVVVPNHQLSLAIGKEGQNARLAARLTGWRIDIRSEQQMRENDISMEDVYLEDAADEPETYDDDYEEYEDDALYADYYADQESACADQESVRAGQESAAPLE